MERLIRKTWVGDYASANDKTMFEHQEEYNKLGKYEDTDLTPEEVSDLAQAKAEGRLVVLPVAIGTTLYIDGDVNYPVKVDDVGVWLQAIEEGQWEPVSNFTADLSSEIQQAREAAEAALEEGGNGND